MVNVTFTADEIKVIRFLEKQYLSIGGKPETMLSPVTTPQEIWANSGLDEPTFERLMARLDALGIAEIHRSAGPNAWVEISKTVVDLVHQFDHQPGATKDYWDDLTKWAKSKKWFALVMLISVAIPWAVGIITGLMFVLKWFGVDK